MDRGSGRDNRPDYYQVLHVQADAPTEVIRSSYRTLMLKLKAHPDLGGEGESAALLNEANRTLCDPVLRREYDLQSGSDGEGRGAGRREGKGGDAPGSTGRRALTRPEYRAGAVCPFCGFPTADGDEERPDLFCQGCRSPLSPAEKIRLEAEQRAVRRMACREALTYHAKWPGERMPGRIRDLSPMGLCMAVDAPLPQGQVVKIDSAILSATVWVASCRAADGSDHAVGVEFITLHFHRPQGIFLSCSI
ncbi:MAG: hypothetical protein C0617_06270 [Desulfuromonas sp.]|uniref:DnaJ domain-containing protein n=1 Tax=Desulfuromonas sp. TaxID=892 RepID=UPI000CC95287|nr:DnaJ domain-containing protein [Desulfuromonas sp.]PLX84944.1 MAG: hypothetical protein C0617_06270 [Desulfuromonas sp.]